MVAETTQRSKAETEDRPADRAGGARREAGAAATPREGAIRAERDALRDLRHEATLSLARILAKQGHVGALFDDHYAALVRCGHISWPVALIGHRDWISTSMTSVFFLSELRTRLGIPFLPGKKRQARTEHKIAQLRARRRAPRRTMH